MIQIVQHNKSKTGLPQALIFDLDETLSATRGLWGQTMQVLLKSLGHEWTEKLATLCNGRNVQDVVATVQAETRTAVPVEECQRRLRVSLFEAYAAGPILPMPGAIECVRRLSEFVPVLAVASGSPLELIQLTVKHLGIDDAFAVLVSSESVTRGKPAPDVFLATAKACGIAPADCLVFEDSLAGAEAARAAGMPSFVIPSIASPELSAVATRLFDSLDEVTLADLESYREQSVSCSAPVSGLTTEH